MSTFYVPIIAAKKGELRSLETLFPDIADKIVPLFELPPQKQGVVLFEKPISRTAIAAGKAWGGRRAFLDISKWAPNAKTENGAHIFQFAVDEFSTAGIEIYPVIGFDRWDDESYRLALTNIRNKYAIAPCIRFRKEEIFDDLMDEEYVAEILSSMLATLNLLPSNCYVMLDFRDVSALTIPDMVISAENAIGLLKSLGFHNIVVAGGSMPTTINEAVNSRDSEGCIARVEMLAWKTIFANSGNKSILFGDYPIRNPDAADGVISPHANAKIRYTIGNQFFVLRGHTKQEHSLTIQHKLLAQKLIASPFYSAPGESWADSELQQCALGIKEIREATSMIAIDTNRHLSAVVSDITSTFEIYEKTVALQKN